MQQEPTLKEVATKLDGVTQTLDGVVHTLGDLVDMLSNLVRRWREEDELVVMRLEKRLPK